MDEQKQVEETKKKCSDCIHYEICSLWATTDLDEDEAHKYCFGHYRHRTPENAVVLTQEEWAVHHEQFAKAMYNKEVTTRKETADKLAEMIIEKHGYSPLTHEGDEDIEIHLTASELYEICNKIKQNTKGEI